ncbi:MAG: hypothetical protein HFH93_09245 [Lachnospiraceae bacterium]|nr:hypothetical protein [Lachnospiraceae bacterium]
MMNDVQLLDCTLRDGGYINNWIWGFENARDIIATLVKADIDVVEVGFLRDIEKYDANITVCDSIEQLNCLLPEKYGNTIFSAMAMQSNYDLTKLTPFLGHGIEMIRVTSHDYDIEEGMRFARKVKEYGYKLSINPINIMGYSDDRVLWIIEQVNTIHPYQFSIVDTFGSMRRRDLERIVSLCDHNLDRDIRLSLHLHENMLFSYGLAQMFIDKHLNRPIAIDGSLMGIGRTPGNLPLELIADYLNDYEDKAYGIEYMMDSIQDYIANLRGKTEWGYTPVYFLSAKYNLHRNYAEYYLGKEDLTNRDINSILGGFERKKASCFDRDYADEKYYEYKNHEVNDLYDIIKLRNEIADKKILILAPGDTLTKHKYEIERFIEKEAPVVISVNFIPKLYKVDYAFFGNARRFIKCDEFNCKLIVTSNLVDAKADYKVNYSRLAGAFKEGFNSYIMLLKLLKEISADREITVAGADGYESNKINYGKEIVGIIPSHEEGYNIIVAKAVENLNLPIQYLTPTKYVIGDKV